MAKVAAKARCCDGGRKAGVGEWKVFPAVTSEIRRFRAGMSNRVREQSSEFDVKQHTEPFFEIDHAMLTKFIRQTLNSTVCPRRSISCVRPTRDCTKIFGGVMRQRGTSWY